MAIAERESAFATCKRGVLAWVEHDPARRGAALAFYSLVSMAPLLLLVIATAGLVWGPDAVRGELYGQLRGLFGEGAAAAVQSMVQSAYIDAGSRWSLIAGLGLTLFGATTVLAELQGTVDELWRRHPPARPEDGGTPSTGLGWRSLVQARLRGLAMLTGLAFLLLVSLALSAGLALLQAVWEPWLQGSGAGVLEAVRQLASLALTAAVFALMYRVLPSHRLARSDVWLGGLVTALLFAVGKAGIGWYLATSAVTSAYGAAGSLVLVMFWVYWSAQVFLLGAAFTWAWSTRGARRSGSTAAAGAGAASAAHGVPR